MASERTEEQKRELYAPSLWRRRTYNGTLSMHTYMLQISAIYQCTKDWLKEVLGRRNK
ncbi:unnamed protein product [Meloidogyne enterolobii]|uniref:Uncharacterized protein n=2 Tax=Meloidogyne enterolobii TaxID=390850 RepID=A0ACB0XPT6_MELEN|nr:unnamed protein product [Meloidogyne enterolobii]